MKTLILGAMRSGKSRVFSGNCRAAPNYHTGPLCPHCDQWMTKVRRSSWALSGDTWNVNPIALRRVEKLFCKNERALIQTRLNATGHLITLVPVAAVLVASIRLHFLDILLHLDYRGPNVIPCDAPFFKGQEMGWFQHGSTIIVFAPDGVAPCDNVTEGTLIRMGQPLLRLPASRADAA